jgi:hypothetical protein
MVASKIDLLCVIERKRCLRPNQVVAVVVAITCKAKFNSTSRPQPILHGHT